MAPRGFPTRPAKDLLDYFTRHGTAANLLLIMMLVLGVISATRIRSQFFPDVVIETVTVSVRWPGAGPEDVDNGIVQVLQPTLLAVEGVQTTSSTSEEGHALIRLDFSPGYNMARAADDVKAAVDSVTNLPADADTPVVRRVVWRDRVTDVVITGPVSTDQLARFADEFTARLFRAGVTRASIRGVSAPETLVEPRESALIHNDVTLRQIADAIAREAATSPAGDIAGGAARVSTGIAKHSADQIRRVVVRARADGSKLRVADVARVHVTGVTRARSYFVGNNPAISIRVDRSNQGDAISLQKTVRQVAEKMGKTLPKGVSIRLIRTRSEAISNRLDLLFNNGLMGLGLVLALLFLFLDVRTAFWVAAGIPASVAAAIALMYVTGLTINMVSLFALIITLGIIVDDAIVVGEHADFRARHLGEGPVEAAENAARRMALPVVSATLTTVIAFFALTAIRGKFGTLISDIPFTVIVVLLASLMECFLILPHHMSHALAHARTRRWYDWPSYGFNIAFSWFRRTIFRPLIALVILLRYPVMAGIVLVLVSQVNLFLKGDVRWRFFNAPERGSVTANFAMVPGATRADSLALMHELQRAVAAVGKTYATKYGTNPVKFVMAEVGGTAGRGLAGESHKNKDLLGAISIELIDADLRPYSSFKFLADFKKAVRRPPLLETLSFHGWRSGPGGDAIDVQLFGASARVLKSAAEALKSALAQYPEVSSLQDDLAYDKQELALELTPQGRALGFTIDGLGRVLRARLNGITAASYPVGARSADITVKLPDSAMSADFLNRMMLRTPKGKYVPLADIVTVSSKAGFASVRREDGLQALSVTGDISGDDAKRANEIKTALQAEILPRIESNYGVSFRLAGLSQQESAFLADAKLGFMLALIGIFLTLAWIFSSWTRPLVVMAIIPFGLVGTIYGHHAWGVPLSLFTVIGLIGMTGIIINDSIVLVSTVDEYARTRDMRRAIIDATADRLRPVLLTTLTTVLGLAPLLFETSKQAQFLKPTVITLSYGLGFGLVLVLLLVPALLAAQRDISLRLNAFRRMLLGRHLVWSQRLALIAAVVAILVVFSGTFGYLAIFGDVMPIFRHLVSGAGQMAQQMLLLGIFVGASAIICVIAALIPALVLYVQHRAQP